MKFTTKKPPIVQSSAKTVKRTLSLHIALIIISLAAVVTNGLHGEGFNLDQSFQTFGILAVGAIVAVIVELFYRLSEGDTSRFGSYEGFIDPINTGLLIALLLPITTPIYVLVLAVVVGTYAGKLVFGGFGYYIFNPALVGVIFVTISFSGIFTGLDTPLLMLKDVYEGGSFVFSDTFTFWDMVFGRYQEIAIGSTSVITLIILFIYLLVAKVVDLRTSGIYLLTVAFMSLGIGFILWEFTDFMSLFYILINMMTGLTLFAAVFLVSDPVSTPTSRETKIIFGVTVAVLMMMMRTLSDNSEGVVFAVLFGNMITPFINRTVKRSNKKALVKTIVGCAIFVVVITVALGFIIQGQIIDNAVAMVGGMI
jgi:electron transport complex protein RnfD